MSNFLGEIGKIEAYGYSLSPLLGSIEKEEQAGKRVKLEEGKIGGRAVTPQKGDSGDEKETRERKSRIIFSKVHSMDQKMAQSEIEEETEALEMAKNTIKITSSSDISLEASNGAKHTLICEKPVDESQVIADDGQLNIGGETISKADFNYFTNLLISIFNIFEKDPKEGIRICFKEETLKTDLSRDLAVSCLTRHGFANELHFFLSSYPLYDTHYRSTI